MKRMMKVISVQITLLMELAYAGLRLLQKT